LREEISALQSAAKCLTKENQSSLETISKLCNLGSKLAGDAQFEMLGQTIAEGFEVQECEGQPKGCLWRFRRYPGVPCLEE
jgi:hypothetical protein